VGWHEDRDAVHPDPGGRGATRPSSPSTGRLRDDCLNIHLFWSLTHAKVTIGDWKEEYEHDRPHSSLGYRTPRAHAAICTH
jgi:transposase InsO family protein